MKSLSTFLVLFAFLAVSYAQIPNAGFENWSAGSPVDWFANNMGGWITITQSSNAHSGSSAVRGEVILFNNAPMPPYIQSLGQGFTFTGQPASIRGYYQFSPQGGDEFYVGVLLYNGTTPVGGGSYESNIAFNSYTQFATDISYISTLIPDKAFIQISVGNSSGDEHVGTYFLADDLEFSSQPVGVNENHAVNDYELKQNYPNPFNPSTVINYSVPVESHVILKVFDVLGNEVAVPVNGMKEAGSHSVSFSAEGLSNGIYIYTLSAGSYNSSRKMILMK